MSMWEPFTERARRTIVLAQQEAKLLGANYIGTEHILLGLMADDVSIARKHLPFSLQDVRKEIINLVKVGVQVNNLPEMTFTPLSKEAIKIAFEESKKLNNNYVSTEHLLLGLLRVPTSIAYKAIINLGAHPDQIRDGIIDENRALNAGTVRSEQKQMNPFDYNYKPRVDQVEKMNDFRESFKLIARDIISKVQNNRERSLALTKLEESAMWLNKSISHDIVDDDR